MVILREQLEELIDCHLRISDNSAERATSNFFMIWNGKRWTSGVTKMDVASLLIADVVTDPLQHAQDIFSGKNRKFAHTGTEMIISFMLLRRLSGIPSSASALRWSWIASFMFLIAWRSVLPCEIHPGSDGHDATNQPSSSFSNAILSFIAVLGSDSF